MHRLWSGLVVVLIAVAHARASAQTPEQDAQRAAEAWLALVDSGRVTTSWEQAATPFRAAVTRDQWSAALQQARGSLGAVRTRSLEEAQLVRDLPGAPPGEYARLRFATVFESSPITENLVMLREGNAWRAVGYFVAPGPAAAGYSAPADAPYTTEEVRIGTPVGVTLAGTLTLPKQRAGRVPAVLLLTGSGPQDRDEAISTIPGYRPFRQIADTLARRGIATLRLDDRGVGGSGGATPDVTPLTFADDARAALAFLRTRLEIDGRRLALLGHSEGGFVAPMVAVSDSAVRAVVLLAAPAWTGLRTSDYQLRDAWQSAGLSPVQIDSIKAVNDPKRDSLAATVPYVRFFLDYDPLPTARRVRVPVLILQGATDRQVAAEQADELAAAMQAAGNQNVSVRIFAGVNHLFLPDFDGSPSGYADLPSKEIPPGVLGAMADWLTEKLK